MSYRRLRLPTRLRRAILPNLGAVERALWLLVFAVLFADLLTTYIGLNAGMTESNPVARSALSQFGFVALVGLKAFSLGVGFVCRRLVPREYVALIPAGLALPWTIAVVVNLSLFVQL
ncbi:DUF5658 family protein [Haladaptatus sp. DFWS20]|uniref:DUF5658 family protein n=1 Tax=Haladaptatus sp. DFWS20 TaxID=3403467 RepID=UPI003EBB9E80